MSDTYGSAAALLEMEAELGEVLTWSGADYPCIIGARRENKTLGDGGYALDAALEVVVRKSVFPNSTPPTTTNEITVNSRVLKIADVMHSPCDTFVVLTCEDATKGV